MTKTEMLVESLRELDELISNKISYNADSYTKWSTKTKMYLKDVFGESSSEYKDFFGIGSVDFMINSFTTEKEIDDSFIDDLIEMKSKLSAYIEYLNKH